MTLKTGVMMLKIQLCHHRNKITFVNIFKYKTVLLNCNNISQNDCILKGFQFFLSFNYALFIKTYCDITQIKRCLLNPIRILNILEDQNGTGSAAANRPGKCQNVSNPAL